MTEPAIAESHHDDSPPASHAGLVTHYQPFYNLSSGRLQGLEALARMDGGEGAAKTPAEFFAEAELSGRIREIEAAILEEALAQTAIWHRDQNRPELILSVNLSAQSVRDRLFVPVIVATVARHQMPGDRLLIDLTTSTFRELLHEGEAAFAGIRALQKREITFCLDSFTARDVDLLDRAVEVPVDIVKLHPALVGGDEAALTDVASCAGGGSSARRRRSRDQRAPAARQPARGRVGPGLLPRGSHHRRRRPGAPRDAGVPVTPHEHRAR